jgi:uncharacterized phosphosugar-binding protein
MLGALGGLEGAVEVFAIGDSHLKFAETVCQRVNGLKQRKLKKRLPK